MKFIPPNPVIEKPELNLDALPEKSEQIRRIEKYSKKYKENPKLGTVSFEDSAMGQIQKELKSQTDVMRDYAAKQEENRKLDKAEARKDAPKRFLRDATISIISAIVGGIVTFVCDNYGKTIIDWFVRFLQN